MIPALVLAAALWLGGTVQTTDGPPQTAVESPEHTALAAFEPLIGQTWRGASTTDASVVDELTFERVAGGRAIRSRHSLNDGAYVGETLITFDAVQGRLVTFYATNGGFYTTGAMQVQGPGAFAFDQVVHGLEGVSEVRATTTLEDGVYRIRSQHWINGAWVDTGGFDYRPIR